MFAEELQFGVKLRLSFTVPGKASLEICSDYLRGYLMAKAKESARGE